jgi:hypothetical protein
MIRNLPTYADLALLAIFIADALLLSIAFLIAGPAFMIGRDLIGRRRMIIGRASQLIILVATLLLAAYIGIQAVIAVRFAGYWSDEGARLCARLERKEAVAYATDGTPLPLGSEEATTARWLHFGPHRFGVTEEIYEIFNVGDIAAGRYRIVDDTLFEIKNVGPARSVAADPAAESAACSAAIDPLRP